MDTEENFLPEVGEAVEIRCLYNPKLRDIVVCQARITAIARRGDVFMRFTFDPLAGQLEVYEPLFNKSYTVRELFYRLSAGDWILLLQDTAKFVQRPVELKVISYDSSYRSS